MKAYIKKHIFDWCVYCIKMFLVAHISYYFFKLLVGFDKIENILAYDEQYYLTGYAFIQTAVIIIFYVAIGKGFEWFIYREIEKNKDDIKIEVSIDDKKNWRKVVYFVFKLLIKLDAISLEELESIGRYEEESEDHLKLWKKTVHIIKSIFGLFVLALTTYFIGWELGLLFWLLIFFLAGLLLLSIVGLLAYYIFIHNLEFLNMFIDSINVSQRHLKIKSKVLDDKSK
ncbi:MAG: hypothetical protein GQ574_08365 [Crocinitomix sp.]|nr:hypothetical protein [Crocinitomix sp.]